MNKIFTDISNLDTLLENGIFEGDIIEICGKPETGKTILATTIAVNLSQFQELGTVYLDINNGFEGTRAHQILRERNCQAEDIESIMQRIVVEKVHSLNDLIDVLEDLYQFLKKSNVKLLVLDSMSAIWFANLFSYKRTVQKIAQVVSLLRKLAHDFKLIVITVNIFLDGFVPESKGLYLKYSGFPFITLYRYQITIRVNRLFSRIPQKRDQLWEIIGCQFQIQD